MTTKFELNIDGAKGSLRYDDCLAAAAFNKNDGNRNSSVIPLSKSLFQIWNIIFKTSLINNGLKYSINYDSYRKSDSALNDSKHSVIIKELPHINQIPQTMSLFIKELDKKMEEFVSTDERFIPLSRNNSMINCSETNKLDSTVSSNCSKETVVEFSCRKIKDYTDLKKKKVLELKIGNLLSPNDHQSDSTDDDVDYRKRQMEFIKTLSSQIHQVGCNMENAVFFESCCSNHGSTTSCNLNADEIYESGPAEIKKPSQQTSSIDNANLHNDNLLLSTNNNYEEDKNEINLTSSVHCSNCNSQINKNIHSAAFTSVSCSALNEIGGNLDFSPSLNSLPNHGKGKTNRAALHYLFEISRLRRNKLYYNKGRKMTKSSNAIITKYLHRNMQTGNYGKRSNRKLAYGSNRAPSVQCCISHYDEIFSEPSSQHSFTNSDELAEGDAYRPDEVYDSKFSRLWNDRHEELRVLYEDNIKQSNESLFVKVPLNLDKNAFVNDGSIIASVKNKILTGMPALPLFNDYRNFVQIKNSLPLSEEIFEDYSCDKAIKRFSGENLKMMKDCVASIDNVEEQVDVEEVNAKSSRTVRTRKYCQHYNNTFNTNVKGKEVIFESTVDLDSTSGRTKILSKTECSEKIHQQLLNNIYRSVSIKIKIGKNKFETIHRRESFIPEIKSQSNGAEKMLSFVIENIENEYMKRNMNMKTQDEFNESMLPDEQSIDPSIIVKQVMTENTAEPVNYDDDDDDDMKSDRVLNSDRNLEKSVHKGKGKVVWKDDTNGIRIISELSDNNINEVEEGNNVQVTTNKHKPSKYQLVNQENRKRMDNVKNIEPYSRQQLSYNNTASRKLSKRFQTNYPRSKTSAQFQSFQMASKYQIKFQDGTYMMCKSKEGGNNRNGMSQKKTSFWGTMLKQTARFMPFFTNQGSKIDLEALGNTLNMEK